MLHLRCMILLERKMLTSTRILAPTLYWPMIESSLGILGACLPTLRPLVNDITPGIVIKSFKELMSFESVASSSQRSAPYVDEKVHVEISSATIPQVPMLFTSSSIDDWV